MTNEGDGYSFSGRIFRAPEIALMREVVATCGGLSRKELANTISELLGWTRPGGALKEPECLALLARLLRSTEALTFWKRSVLASTAQNEASEGTED